MATIHDQLNTPRDSTLKTTEQTPRNIADVLADELSGIAQALGGSTDYDDLSHRPQINSVTLTGDKSADDLSLAMQEDLTSIKATGTTNATGSTITSGTFFYLNGTLCKAKSDIASGATFTANTNYEVVTAGGLNSLNSAIATKVSKTKSSAGWVGSFSVTLEESHLYLFISQRYGDVVILTVFSGGTVGAKVVAGNNWSFTSANFVLTGTASSAADYAIIEVG